MSEFTEQIHTQVIKVFPPETQVVVIKDTNEIAPRVSFIFESFVFKFTLNTVYAKDGKTVSSTLSLEAIDEGRTLLNLTQPHSEENMPAFLGCVQNICARSFIRREKLKELQKLSSFLEKIAATLPTGRG